MTTKLPGSEWRQRSLAKDPTTPSATSALLEPARVVVSTPALVDKLHDVLARWIVRRDWSKTGDGRVPTLKVTDHGYGGDATSRREGRQGERRLHVLLAGNPDRCVGLPDLLKLNRKGRVRSGAPCPCTYTQKVRDP